MMGYGLAPSALANDLQSFESCSLITSEYITVLQLVQRGFDKAALAEALPGLSDEGRRRMEELYRAAEEDGLEATYSAVNSEYARCSRKVFNRTGEPPWISREGHFYFCAGENKVRYEILMAGMVGGKAEEIVPQLSEMHRPTAQATLKLHDGEGALVVFDALGDELKFCINNNL